MAERCVVTIHIPAASKTLRVRAPAARRVAKVVEKVLASCGVDARAHAVTFADGRPLAPDATVADLPSDSLLVVEAGAASGSEPDFEDVTDATHGGNGFAALLASHVSDAARLARLETCVASIVAQAELPDALRVGLSAASAALGDAAAAVFEAARPALETRGCALHVVRSRRPRRQFEHVAAVAKHCDAAMVMFSDDDDEWHAERVATYARAAARVVLVSPRYAVNDGAALEVVASPPGSLPSNYWDLALPSALLRQYVEKTDPREYASPFADCAFLEWLLKTGAFATARRVEPRDGCWMYLWRQDHAQRPQHAARLNAELAEEVDGGLADALGDPRGRSWFAAAYEAGMGRRVDAARIPVDALVGAYRDRVLAAERDVELGRIALFHGRWSRADLAATGLPSHGAPAGDRRVLFPREDAMATRQAADAAALLEANPASDVEAHLDAGERLVRRYAAARLRRRTHFAYVAVDADAVAAAFRAASYEFTG